MKNLSQEQIEDFHRVLKSNEWKTLWGVMQDFADTLNSIEEIDTNLEPVQIKIEIESRRKAREVLVAFMETARGLGEQDKTSPLLRSMK